MTLTEPSPVPTGPTDRRVNLPRPRLDDLRGNMGAQFHAVRADVEIGSPWTVPDRSQTFDVPIANATPA